MNRRRIAQFTTLEEFKKESLADPKVKAAYDALEEEFELINMLVGARLEKKMTQAELARRAGMKQAAIARMESGKSSPSLKTMNRIAKALDKKISFV